MLLASKNVFMNTSQSFSLYIVAIVYLHFLLRIAFSSDEDHPKSKISFSLSSTNLKLNPDC